MDSYKICMIALLCVFLVLILKEMKSSLSLAVKIACAIFVFVVALSILSPLIEIAKSTAQTSGLSSYLALLIKALGIAFSTEICAEICRDCGEAAVSSGIELVGRAEILLLSVPLIKEIIETAEGVMT